MQVIAGLFIGFVTLEPKMKVAIITCYRDPDYIRAQTLRTAVSAQPDTEAIIIKNKHTGWLRYPEVVIRLIIARLRHKPDVYLLTFRGYEILPFVLLVAWRQPVIFDEFINLIEWVVYEHQKISESSRPGKLLAVYYRYLLNKCRYILTDTPEHAAYSSNLSEIDPTRYRAIPVSTNEQLFKPAKRQPSKKSNQAFQVLYYGNMLPLHGLQYVLEAAIRLKDQPLEFLLVGGKAETGQAIAQAQSGGAHIAHEAWIKFENLPQYIAAADLCLGGPFGDTTQAQFVITGKTFQFLASAVPTVVGRNQATASFKDKKNCLLVPLGDAAGLAKALSWARTHHKDLLSIGKSGRKLYEHEFSQAVVADKLGTILRDCLGATDNSPV
jgi:glycosyltransferase involved in cell wall biosynthesis